MLLRRAALCWVQAWAALVCTAATVYLQPQMVVDLLSWLNPSVLFSFDRARTGNRCALTIDDSPSSSTPQILRLLKQYDAKATFFVIASHVRGREELMRRILEEGHEIGNHMTEDQPSLRLSPQSFEQSFVATDRTLRVYQPVMKWFRPGSGFFSGRMLKTVHEAGYTLALGNIFPHDPQIKSPSLNSWFLRTRARPGGIIIIHDRPWTPETLLLALPAMKERGLELTTLSAMAKADGKRGIHA